MEVLYFFLFCIALIAPALLVFYDVCFPRFSLKILREKIFLKLGILGVYAYPLSPYCLSLILLTMAFLIQSRQKSPYDILCIVIVYIVCGLFLMFFEFEGENKVVPLLLLFIFALCVGLTLIVLYILHLLKKDRQ